MAFWSQNTTEPKQKHKFKVEIGLTSESFETVGGIVWWAKSVNFPTLEYNVNEYQLGNHKFKYPGIATYGDVTLTFVDPEKEINNILISLNSAGWGTLGLDGDFAPYDQGYMKQGSIGYFKIYAIDANGNTKEEWSLINPFIKSMNFGDLSYDSEDLVEFQMVVANDGFDFTQK